MAYGNSLPNYELSFTIELASDWSITGDWQSILHIGDSDGQRLPGIWFHGTENKMVVAQSHSGQTDSCALYADDFSSIDSGWISVDGDWSWSGGTVDNNVGNYGEGNVLYRDADYSDGYLEASVSLSSGEQAGLLFRIADMPAAADYINNAGQAYYCAIRYDRVLCGRFGGGIYSALEGTDFKYYTGITYGQFYDLGINMEGSEFTVFLDGAEIGSFSDSSYSSGGVGLRVRYARGIYDSISYKAAGCAESHIFQASRCYPQSEAPYINTGGSMLSSLTEAGSPKECYDWCVGSPTGYMGLELNFDSYHSPTGHECMCNRPRG